MDLFYSVSNNSVVVLPDLCWGCSGCVLPFMGQVGFRVDFDHFSQLGVVLSRYGVCLFNKEFPGCSLWGIFITPVVGSNNFWCLPELDGSRYWDGDGDNAGGDQRPHLPAGSHPAVRNPFRWEQATGEGHDPPAGQSRGTAHGRTVRRSEPALCCGTGRRR